MRFSVESSPTRVSAWSQTRLQFQPRGWQLQYRHELREAVKELRPQTGAGLLAEYFTPDQTFADIENVLLYNVGMSVFAPLTAAGLTCRRDRSPNKRHEIRYSTVEALPRPGAGPEIGQAVTDLGPTVPRNAGQWWAALRRSASLPGPAKDSAPADARDSTFTADIVLAGPGPHRLTSLVKPLLDGLISVFHAHDGSHEQVLRERFGSQHLPTDAWQRLMDDDTNCLGRRPLVRPFKAGIAWNPADDRCSAFRIRAEASPHWIVTAQLHRAQ